MNGRALIYGTIAIDTIITPNGKANYLMGGSAPYAALSARFFTENADMVGVVGEDFPEKWEKSLEARGVSMKHVAHEPGITFAWAGQYEADMNIRKTLRRIEGVQKNWQLELSPALRECSVAVACNVTPRMQCRMLEQCPHTVFRMADSMKSWFEREPEYTAKLLKSVDLMLMNDEEAQFWAKTNDSIEAGEKILTAGPRYAIVKHGSAGSTLFHRSKDRKLHIFRCPAWPLKHAKDPTGAGDSYMGALAGYLTACTSTAKPTWEQLKQGIALATIVAGISCERFGTAALFSVTREELARRIIKFRQMTQWG